MAYRYNYNERSCFEGEDHRDNWDIPSAKAVQDTLVEECDGKIVGDLPISKGKLWGTFAAIAGSAAAVLTALMLIAH